MNDNVKKAAKRLSSSEYTCVLCRDDLFYVHTARGVKPLLEWLDSGQSFAGFSAADKVVGKAAAFLYVLLDVDAVFAPVMSKAAADTLSRHGITPFYDTLVPVIRNRTNTGFCPMEQTVLDIDTPNEALTAIRDRLAQLTTM